MGSVELAAVEEAVSLAEFADALGGKAPALETDMVHPADFRRVAVGDHEGGDILHDLGATADYGVGADSAELMDAAEAADDRVVAHGHMARECAVIGENHVVADDAVMGDVGVGEEVSSASETCDPLGGRGAVNRDELAEDVPVADFELRRLTRVLKILAPLPDGGVRVELVVVADDGRSGKGDVIVETASLAKNDARPDDAVGSDLGGLADVGRGVDDRRGMDARHGRPQVSG